MACDAFNTPEQMDADAEQWVADFRNAGGGFQLFSEPDDAVWIWVPLTAGTTAAEMLAELPGHLRPRITAVVKPRLRASAGWY